LLLWGIGERFDGVSGGERGLTAAVMTLPKLKIVLWIGAVL
jgi:hypothetical protein